MAVKILISGVSNSGKTTLTSSLDPKTTLVISHDGKFFPYAIPHVNVSTFESSQELITIVTDKLNSFKEKFGYYPTNIVFDSVSKIFDTLMDAMNNKFTGFNIYSNLNKEITTFTNFIQNSLIASDINVIILSHAIYDSETTNYNLVGKGDFQKRGNFLAEVDHAVFIETKGNKRIIHHRSTKFPARTLLPELPDSQPIADYSLKDHIEQISKLKDEVQDFEL